MCGGGERNATYGLHFLEQADEPASGGVYGATHVLDVLARGAGEPASGGVWLYRSLTTACLAP